MKKFVKLSLAAAVASTGFVSANAGALEDAVKNTSILGYATYRYDDRTIDNTDATSFSNSTNNSHKIVVGLISKINDALSYTYAGAVTGSQNTGAAGSNVDYMGGNLYSVYSYFTYTGINNVAINVGQQTIDTPFTDTYDDIAGTQEGTGVTSSTSIAGINLFAGYYNNSNLSMNGTAVGTEDIVALAASGQAGPVALDVTYVDVENQGDGYSIGAKTTLGMFSPYARFTTMSWDSGDDSQIWFVGSKAKMGAFGANISHTQTGKDNSSVAFDLDAASVNQGWGLNLYNKDGDSDLTKLNANYNLTSQVNVAVNHNFGEINTVDSDETYGQLTWKPSKNFYAYLRYGQVEKDGSETAQRGRIHMTYKF